MIAAQKAEGLGDDDFATCVFAKKARPWRVCLLREHQRPRR